MAAVADGLAARIGAALAAPRRALAASDRPEGAGRAPGDLVLLALMVFVAIHLEELVRAGWLAAAGEVNGGLSLLVAELGSFLRQPLVALLIGVVAVTAAAGRRRRFGADSDLACVAMIPAMVLFAALGLAEAALGPLAWLRTAARALAALWYAALLVAAIRQARRRSAEPGEAPPLPRRARTAGRAALALVAATFLVGCGHAAEHWDELEPTTAGDAAPELALPRIEDGGRLGDEVRLSSLRGRVVVIDFWATWCGPCRASMPRLEAVVRRHPDVQLLSVEIEGARSAAEAWRLGHKLAPSALLLSDTRGVAGSRYAVSTIPHFVVVDRAGVIRMVHRGGLTRSAAEELDRALGGLTAGD